MNREDGLKQIECSVFVRGPRSQWLLYPRKLAKRFSGPFAPTGSVEQEITEITEEVETQRRFPWPILATPGT
jgi:hypothetical protein